MHEASRLRQAALGEKLRDLRINRGMTTRSVAAALGISPSSVNRTELGHRHPSRDEVNSLCTLYGVTGEDKVLLMERASKPLDTEPWLEVAAGERDHFVALLSLEQEATTIVNIQTMVIPGLLQIPEYSRKLINLSKLIQEDPEQRVATRLSRQAILSRPENRPSLTFIVEEGTLYRTLGESRLLREQLEHVLVMVQRHDNITFKVLPFTSVAHAAIDGSYSMYVLPDGTTYVYVESFCFGVFLTEKPTVDAYVAARWDLEDCVLDEKASLELVRRAIKELADAGPELA